MNREQKITVTIAFKKIALAYGLEPKALAKTILKEFEEKPPKTITFHLPEGAAQKAKAAVVLLASLPIEKLGLQ